jgi:hypothetical protein
MHLPPGGRDENFAGGERRKYKHLIPEQVKFSLHLYLKRFNVSFSYVGSLEAGIKSVMFCCVNVILVCIHPL